MIPPVLLVILRPALPYLLAGAAVLAVLGWAYHRGVARTETRLERAATTQELEQRRTRDAVERGVAADPDPGAALLREWSRP